MGEDGDKEVFLSLEDDGLAPSVAPKPAVVAQPEPEGVVEEEVLIPEMADTTFVQDASGSFTVSWPLLGMDCPDCASKAMGALGHMKQVTTSNVSATSGEVKISINLEDGAMSECPPCCVPSDMHPMLNTTKSSAFEPWRLHAETGCPFRNWNAPSADSRVCWTLKFG